MLFAEQIIDRLNGIEGAEGHFNEDGAPVAHGTIPKTR
jgi:hypothetical protein